MSNVMTNINAAKVCAFCKYWWDPACKYITPHINAQWYYDNTAKCRCIKRSVDMPAHASCGYFRCKIDL